jgi:ribosomal protein S18 acetylase RimI-like enzyme
MKNTFKIRFATKKDVHLLFCFIKQFAEYGNVSHELKATEEILEESLFGQKSYAEVIIGYLNQEPVSYALFSHNFSTLLGRPGLYLVDLFVIPEARNQGIGRSMLVYLAELAKKRKCGRLEWSVLNSNKLGIMLYKAVGAKPMDEWTTYRVSGTALDKLAVEPNLKNY